MAAEILYNAKIVINSVDLSNRCREARFSRNRPPVDASAMGDRSHVMLAGIEEWSLSCVFAQDFAAGSVHATLNPLVTSAGFPIEFLKENAVEGATNPKYTGTAIMEGYNPIEGTFGNLVTVSPTFRAAGDITRDITP